MSRFRLSLLAVAAGALLAAGATHASNQKVAKLFGQSGPGYTITLKTSLKGKLVKTLKPGRYTFEIEDRTTSHNFHLSGPGVNKKTGVGFLGGVEWKRVKLVKGTYRYWCDVHRSAMHGSFRVT